MTLDQLTSLFADAGCIKLYAKILSDNDNSKNQVYVGPGFEALNIFPTEDVKADSGPKAPIFKAKVRFGWLQLNGSIAEAPNAQFILYPQYPEVRFSGFLLGCAAAPSELMRERQNGRILLLGVTRDRCIVGFVVAPESSLAAEYKARISPPTEGIFAVVALPAGVDEVAARARLLAELGRIHRLGWIASKQLDSRGVLRPCNAPQCGGFTLEAELGIPKNSAAEPDFYGWEIKQHGVGSFERTTAGAITLMTPEPTGGFYRQHGVEAFVRKYGYEDKRGREDRLNFGGRHKFGSRHSTTQLSLALLGFDSVAGKITDPGGCVALLTDTKEIAASWGFERLLAHWSRKHSRAAYVPSQCRSEPERQYRYGNKIRLGVRTDALRLLGAMAAGAVYYDPLSKVEGASGSTVRVKPRNQFRIDSKNIPALYERVETVLV